MNFKKGLTELSMSRTQLALIMSFSLLFSGQILLGFNDFEDYLIVFIFILFLNDLYIKIKQSNMTCVQYERSKRFFMTGFFLLLFALAFFLDALNVSNAIRLFIYRLGFMLWAQVFLLDAFLNYKQTQSRRWLLITNMAALLIVVGAFIY